MSHGSVSRAHIPAPGTISLNKAVHSDLMAKDDFKNLGFHNATEDSASSKAAGGSDAQGKGT